MTLCEGVRFGANFHQSTNVLFRAFPAFGSEAVLRRFWDSDASTAAGSKETQIPISQFIVSIPIQEFLNLKLEGCSQRPLGLG